jgi:hypothetical protein
LEDHFLKEPPAAGVILKEKGGYKEKNGEHKNLEHLKRKSVAVFTTGTKMS